jgi:penicillin-binding protein 1A
MGVRSPLPPVPSTALGSNGATVLDMASAYDTLAGDGIHTDPVFVTRVTTSDGTVLYRAPLQRSRAMPETTARTINGVLQQVVTRGTGVNARIGRAVAGKTGTSDNWADAWFVGYTPQLVTAVWVGFPAKEIKMRPPTTRITVTGGSWPAQIWQAYEGGALAETPVAGFPAPEAPTTTTTTRAAPAAARPPLLSAVGLSVADATRDLRQAGFQVRFVSVPSREVAPGTVVSQIPAAGRPAKPGSKVTIQVSSGPPHSLPVPSVLGDYADQAATALRAAGFEVSVVVKAEPPPGSPARAGRVWMQSPISGTIADEGTTVALSVNPAY